MLVGDTEAGKDMEAWEGCDSGCCYLEGRRMEGSMAEVEVGSSDFCFYVSYIILFRVCDFFFRGCGWFSLYFKCDFYDVGDDVSIYVLTCGVFSFFNFKIHDDFDF